MNLQERYTELFTKIGFKPNEINTLWVDLEKAYSGKSRHYHNLNHLKEMIALFDEYENKLKNPLEVLFSIFYHDYIYKASRKDN